MTQSEIKIEIFPYDRCLVTHVEDNIFYAIIYSRTKKTIDVLSQNLNYLCRNVYFLLRRVRVSNPDIHNQVENSLPESIRPEIRRLLGAKIAYLVLSNVRLLSKTSNSIS